MDGIEHDPSLAAVFLGQRLEHVHAVLGHASREHPALDVEFVDGLVESSGILDDADKVLARWIVDRRPLRDPVDIDVRRMQPFQGTRQYLSDRTVETLGLSSAILSSSPPKEMEVRISCMRNYTAAQLPAVRIINSLARN
ncbi:MAG: hypothetical protein QM696_02340 [Steroidobacteraceae bacterium]